VDESLRVDVEAMQKRYAKATVGLDNLPLWIARWFGASLLWCAGLLFVLPRLFDGRLPTASDFASKRGLFEMVTTVIVAAVTTALRYRNVRRISRTAPEVLEANIVKNWLYFVGPGWQVRLLRMGLLMALAIGISIGTLMATTSPISELPGQSRLLMVLVFTAGTAAWVFPMMFAFRFLSIRSQRKLILAESP
jgi:hypothetical protein